MSKGKKRSGARPGRPQPLRGTKGKRKGARLWYVGGQRSEERFSRNAETDLVCRLLLEKKNAGAPGEARDRRVTPPPGYRVHRARARTPARPTARVATTP